MRLLTVNAGSSSLKLSLIDERDQMLATQELPAPRSTIDTGELRRVIAEGFAGADAIVHRIVHGGRRFHDPVVVDPEVERELRGLCDLAPLHQLKSLAALDAVTGLLPDLPAVACFDTGFHATLPPSAYTYALPSRWRERWGLRRFGFHGLSHSWVAGRAPQLIGADPKTTRIISCHLGAGASLCAIQGGASIDTTMGFTPLDGLVMATRSGSLDPGMLLWLLEHETVTERELAHALEHESGLTAIAGTGDMRELLARSDRGDESATLALDVYLHRLKSGIAAMASALGGLDLLVFTGGVGEHAPEIRERAAAGLHFLGVRLDPVANRQETGDGDVTPAGSAVRTLVLRAHEDLEMAHQARRVLPR